MTDALDHAAALACNRPRLGPTVAVHGTARARATAALKAWFRGLPCRRILLAAHERPVESGLPRRPRPDGPDRALRSRNPAFDIVSDVDVVRRPLLVHVRKRNLSR